MAVEKLPTCTFTWDVYAAQNHAKAAAASKRPYAFGPGPSTTGKRTKPWTLADMARVQAQLFAKGKLRYVEPNPFGEVA